jgi:hypothetical protein
MKNTPFDLANAVRELYTESNLTQTNGWFILTLLLKLPVIDCGISRKHSRIENKKYTKMIKHTSKCS